MNHTLAEPATSEPGRRVTLLWLLEHPERACQGAPTEVFFPSGYEPESEPPYPTPEALGYCTRCPILTDCLQYALEHREPYGIWGGHTSYQRSQLLRPCERKYCPSCGSDEIVTENRNEVCVACATSWPII